MKKINFFEKLWEHSRTLRRVGLVLVMCLITLPQAWAWYVKGSFDSWTVHDIGADGGSVTYYDMAPGTYYYQFSDKSNSNWSGGDLIVNKETWDDHKSLKSSDFGLTSSQMTVRIYENSHISIQKITGDGWQLKIYVRPAYYFRYDWAIDSWGWSGWLVSCGDGTYATEGKYNNYATGFNYNTRPEGGSEKPWCTNLIKSGDPTHEVKCFFIYNPDNSNRSLTIEEKNSTGGTNHMYFDNTNAGWTDSKIQLVLGHLSYSRSYTMSKVGSNDYTNLYYVSRSGNNWTGEDCFAYFGMIGGSSKFTDGAWASKSMYDANHHSAPLYKHQNLSDGYNYVISKADNVNGHPITIEEKGTGYASLNYTQTVKYQLSKNGTAYADMSASDGATPATITASSYRLSGRSSVSGTSLGEALTVNTTTRYSSTITACHTGKTTLTVSNVRPGYQFIGWYEGNTQKSTATSYTYRPTGEATVSARFKKLYAYVEGRFEVRDENGDVLSTASNGDWKTDVRTIPMEYDETNNRFVLHTHSTLTQLKANIGSQGSGKQEPYFFIRTSSSTSSWTDGGQYWAHSEGSSYQNLASRGSKKSCDGSNKAFTFTGTEAGYVVLYCDASDVWYDMEYTVDYKKNGGASGADGSVTGTTNDASSPYISGTQVTTIANGYTNSGHKFKWWNTNYGGTGEDFYVGEKFTISANTNLYAQWESVGSDEEFWVGDNFTFSSHVMSVGDMRLKENNVDSNTDITQNYNQVSKYSSTAKKAKVLAMDAANEYLEVYFSDGSAINKLKLGTVHNESSGTKKVVVIYSTTADFTSGVSEQIEVSIPTCNQSSKSVTDFSPSKEDTYKYARIYKSVSSAVYSYTGPSSGGAEKMRIYSIKAQKGSSCTATAPGALAKSSVTAKGATLTVTDEADTNDYEFYVSTDDDEPGAGTSATHSVTSGKSLTITDLYAGTTFYAWARAKCGSNKSDWTALTGSNFSTSTVSADYDLTNVTKTSGATSGIGGSEFEAVFAAASGYSLPTPTVTIDGNTATSGTDYTWSSGTLTIPANKINGNIVITLNSAPSAPSSATISGTYHYFPGENISLTCTPSGNNGPTTYQWYKGGKADGNMIDGATSATYTKNSCTFDDAGSYFCKVTCNATSIWAKSGSSYDVTILRLYVKNSKGGDPYGNVDFVKVSSTTATASISLGSGTTYGFNIADGCGHYYGNNGTMQYNSYGPWVTNQDGTDCGLTTTNAGTYIFTIDYSTWSQITTTVTFPSCTDPGLAYATGSVTKTLCDGSFTNTLTNTNSVSVSYESSDTDVAEVASDGTVTLKAAGTVTITASSEEQTISSTTYCEDEASYTLTISSSTAAGLSYGTSTVKKNVGDASFTNTLTNSNSLEVTYTSSDEDVATVASNGAVTIKAAGTTTITASSAQQEVSSTCYAAGEASYTLTVYPVYTVTYNAMGGTCSPTSTNTTTALGKVTLPSATHASYTTYSWVTSDGTEAGDAGDTYTPEGNINLYAKWQGSCAGGGGSGTTIYKALIKTSGLNTDKTTIDGLSGAQSFTTSNYLSELDGGTLTLNINTAGQATVQKDSMIRITNVATYWTITLTGGNSLQAGDIIRTRIKNQTGYLQKTSGSYSATTDVALTKNTEYVTIVPNSLVGATTLYLKAASGNMDLTYVEIYRPAETLVYMHVNDGLTDGNIDTEETKQTAGESNLLRAVSGGDVYTGATTAGHIKIVNTSEIQLNNNTGYIKLALPKALAEGDVLYFRSSHNYELAITSGDSRDATIRTSAKTYTIPKSSTLIDVSTIYLWYYSSAANVKTLAIVRPSGGSSCHTVTYHGNGSTGGYTNDPTQYEDEDDPEVLDCGYTRTGYDFIGWADGTDHRDAETVDYQPGDIIEDISSDVTLYAIWKQIKYFTGAASTTSWNTDGNWSPSGVPAITDPVVIQHDVTVDINNAKALSIDIETGNTLTINAGKALIIEKTLTKAGGATAAADVIINSTRAAGTGALIIGDYSSASNAATVNFETRAKRDGSGNWINQFVGSPFSNCAPYVDYAIQMYAFAPRGNGDHGGWWSTVNSGSTLTPFIGYTILYNSADELDVTWTGSLNATSDITLNGSNTNLYYSANPTDNLLANSWMAPIHMDEFDEDDFTNIEKTIYIFNSGSPQDYEKAEATSSLSSNTSTAAGTYVSIPVSSSPWIEGMPKVIPAMQGFAVLATGSSPSLKLEYDKLVYTPALTSVGIIPNRAPKRAAAEDAPDVITLRVQGENGWAANAYVLGREDFTNGFDDGWDGRFMEGEETAPQLYAPTPDGEMMVNCVPEIEGTVMAFHAGSLDNSYTCTFVYNGGEIWYLNDLKEEKSTLISNETSYPFVSVAGDKAARFVISKTPINKIVTDIDEANGEKDAKVRKLLIDDHIYIIRGGKMYTADGALVK